jgi:putative SOS response-associated peptidase YedK
MCGRFTLTVNPAELQEAFSDYSFPQQFAPRYNIAPTQPVLAIPNDDQNMADFFVWGLIPMWAKDPTCLSRQSQVQTLPDPGRWLL